MINIESYKNKDRTLQNKIKQQSDKLWIVKDDYD